MAASTGSAIDTMLSPVLDAFGAADVSQLPAAIGKKYEAVKAQLLSIPGLTGDQLASAMGPALVNGLVALSQHNPAAAAMMLYHGLESVMAMGGGPIGSAAAAGMDAVPAIMQLLGGTAHGGGDQCTACTDNNQMWYGAWDIWQHKPPVQPTQPDGTPDPRWVHWDNKSTKGPLVKGSDGNWDGQCADDLPTVDMSPQGLNRWVCNQGEGTNTVSGNFLTLPYVINGVYVASPPGFGILPGLPKKIPVPKGMPGAVYVQPFAKDSFDYSLAHTILMMLEQYLNGQGPRPVTSSAQQVGQNDWATVPAGPGEINLRDVIENMVWGWNAIHEPGQRVQINTPPPVYYVTSTWQGKTSSTPVEDTSIFWDGRAKPGDYARHFIMKDPRAQDVPLYLNTGPLLPSIQDLFGSLPPTTPPKKIVIKPIVMGGKPLPVTATHVVLPPPSPKTAAAPTTRGTGLTSKPRQVPSLDVAAPLPKHAPPPSPVGFVSLVGAGVALAAGMPMIALPILGAGAIIGLVRAYA